MPFVPKKLYYKIREVCTIVGVESHVLRFWESEFPALAPPKTKSGQRIYRPKDIELLLRIRRLLYDEGFTIAGARKQLNAPEAHTGTASKPSDEAGKIQPSPKTELKTEKTPDPDRLKKVKTELENILTLLDRE